MTPVTHPWAAWAPILGQLGLLAALGLVDAWIIWRDGVEASMSVQCYRLCCEEPILPSLVMFLVGVVVGHILWTHRG